MGVACGQKGGGRENGETNRRDLRQVDRRYVPPRKRKGNLESRQNPPPQPPIAPATANTRESSASKGIACLVGVEDLEKLLVDNGDALHGVVLQPHDRPLDQQLVGRLRDEQLATRA